MGGTQHVFDYLDAPSKPPPGLCVVFGDEDFLKRLALKALRTQLLANPEEPYARFEGNEADWRDVADEVSTASLFGGGAPRMVLVDEADKFVTRYRDRLEKLLAKPRGRGVMVLEVNTWLGTTRLYQQLEQHGLQIDCRPPRMVRGNRKVPDTQRVVAWLIAWADQRHQLKLSRPAAQLLMDLTRADFGRMDQELAKLGLFAGLGGSVAPKLVQEVTGGWKAQTSWELIDAACDGKASAALLQLDHLFQSGESPTSLFPQFSWSLRRFAAATRIYERAEREGRRMPLRKALEQAGFRPWPQNALERAEQQIKRMGRARTGQIFRWLLETDLALKGSHSAPHRARQLLELLILRLAEKATPAPGRPK